jgi:hypothetical protein
VDAFKKVSNGISVTVVVDGDGCSDMVEGRSTLISLREIRHISLFATDLGRKATKSWNFNNTRRMVGCFKMTKHSLNLHLSHLKMETFHKNENFNLKNTKIG